MRHTSKLAGCVGVVVLSIALLASRAWSQGGGEDRPMTNLTRFKGKSRKEVVQIMKGYNRDLGVKCSHCHVKDFALDDKQEKQTARQMITMLADINEKYPATEKKGTCYMCHRGAKDPVFEPGATGQ